MGRESKRPTGSNRDKVKLITRMSKAYREGRGIRLTHDDLWTLHLIGWITANDTEESLMQEIERLPT